MNAEVTSADKAHEKPGKKHWLFQVIPPLLMLGVFVITTNGTSLVFLVGLLLLPVLVSFVSIIVRLISFKKKKYFLVRPVLTISTWIRPSVKPRPFIDYVTKIHLALKNPSDGA
jgi:hypothetical protein